MSTAIVIEDQQVPTTVSVADTPVQVSVVEQTTSVTCVGDAISISVQSVSTTLTVVETVVTATLVDSREDVTVLVQPASGGFGRGCEDLTFSYVGGVLTTITGETYVRSLTYNVDGLISTVYDTDTDITKTLGYNVDDYIISLTCSAGAPVAPPAAPTFTGGATFTIEETP